MTDIDLDRQLRDELDRLRPPDLAEGSRPGCARRRKSAGETSIVGCRSGAVFASL
jgi:hypothetical protein